MRKKLTITPTTELSLTQAFALYERHGMLRNLSADTIKHNRNEFHAFELFLDDDPPISALNGMLVKQFIDHRINQGVKAVTINTTLRVLRAFINWCVAEGYLKKFSIQLLKTEETIKETYSKHELALLLKKPNLKKCSFTEYRNWVIVNYLLATGNRVSTVTNLKIADLNLEEGYIQLTKVKSRRQQPIPLTPTLFNILTEYLQYRGSDGEYLFPNSYGDQFSRDGLSKAIASYNHSRGVEKTSIHAFRHTFAMLAIVDGKIDVFRLQLLLGHSDIKSTQHYVKLFATDLKQDQHLYNPLELLSQEIGSKKGIQMQKKAIGAK